MKTKEIQIKINNLDEQMYIDIIKELCLTKQEYPEIHIEVKNIFEDGETFWQEIE